MNGKTSILTIVFFVISIVLGVFLANGISSKIAEDEKIALVEKQVAEKLSIIRQAEKAYLAVNGQYTSDWSKLISFIDTGKFTLIERKEITKLLDYGAEEVTVELDTLGYVSVKDSLFSLSKYPDFKLKELPLIPNIDKSKKNEPLDTFGIFAGKLDRSGIEINVIEVWDTNPINKNRKESYDEFARKPLRFGSQYDVTTSGNWE